MTNYKNLAIGAVIFAFLSYFLLLPLISSGLEVFKNMIINYFFKLLHKLAVVGVVLAGTTSVYFAQKALRSIDRESVKAQMDIVKHCSHVCKGRQRQAAYRGHGGKCGTVALPGRGMLQNCDHLITDTLAACRRVPNCDTMPNTDRSGAKRTEKR